MKSVTNSNRVPFQVKRNGHDDGLRSSSVIGGTDARAVVEVGVSAWTMRHGQRTRTASAPVLEPRPKITSAGATGGDEDDVSIVCRRLPARRSTFAPSALRLLTRPVRRTRSEALRSPPSFLH